MAYDKVVDSVALDTQLTSIADAIRAKTGGTDSLVFPDGFSQAIAAIEAGGGGGDKTLAYGEFTPATDCGVIEIEHGLGVQPKMFVEIEQYDKSDFKQYDNMFSFFAEAYDGTILSVAVCHASSSSAKNHSLQFRSGLTYSDLYTGYNSLYGQVKMANETKVVVGNDSSFYRFRGGKKIYWVAKG